MSDVLHDIAGFAHGLITTNTNLQHENERLQERIAELEALVVDCMESDNEYLSEWDKKARALGLTPPLGAE